ncbi:MAG: hypothetical protein AB7E77_10725 [Desulfobulbus sp.]
MRGPLCLFTLLVLALLPQAGWGTDAPWLVHWQLQQEALYVYRFDMDGLNWRQIRQERQERNTIQEEPKHIDLRRGLLDDPFAADDAAWREGDAAFPQGTIYILDPDGACKQTPVTAGMREIVLPENMDLNGRYLIGGHFLLGRCEVQGALVQMHLYPKAMVGHYKSGGRPGSFPAFFFNQPDIALEIGSALSPAQYRMGGGFQRPHESSEMEVRYRGRPLAGAVVEVFAEGSGWRRQYRTDASGRFTVIPFDDRSRQRHYEKLLYVVRVEDPQNHILHVATLPMIIFRNRPEWTSHMWGYGIWAGLGLVGTLLLAGGSVMRRRQQQRRSLVRFDQCRVKEN